MTAVLRVAAAQYPVERLPGWDAYAAKAARWVGGAAAAGARLLVFPEYGALELTALAGADGDLARQTAALQDLVPAFVGLYRGLAVRHRVHVLAPSLPVRRADGRLLNTAWFLGPEGGAGRQEKLIPTPFERAHWDLAGGDTARVFDTPFGRVGVAICYDAEYPLVVRRMVEAGAGLILAPSCTDSVAGWWRVRIGARARALENQCYVVQAPTVGAAPWCPAIDENTGAAGVFAPPDVGLPEDGVLASGTRDAPGWVFADLDRARLETVRAAGRVRNHTHWPEQSRLGPAETVALSQDDDAIKW